MVRALLSAGAKVDLLATKAASPLHVACFKGYMEVVRALLSAGAKVNLQSVDGMSPLNMACHKGHTEVVRALLSVGAKVNLQASDGSTPLHPACEFGHIGVVRALLSDGAKADLLIMDSKTPLHLLPRALHAEVEHLVQQAKEERGSAMADESIVGAPSAPAAVLLRPHNQAASLLQAASKDGVEG